MMVILVRRIEFRQSVKSKKDFFEEDVKKGGGHEANFGGPQKEFSLKKESNEADSI